MKISNLNLLNFNNIYKQVSFNGINRKKDSCIFVYDLDGTLANGTNEQIYKVLEISKARNAKVTYATGRGVKEQAVQEYLTDSSGILGQINLETLNNVHAIAPNILKAKKT